MDSSCLNTYGLGDQHPIDAMNGPIARFDVWLKYQNVPDPEALRSIDS